MQAQGRRTPPTDASPTSSGAETASYRFLVRSAEEAVGAIRSQLGDNARVVSVRSVKAAGVAGLLGGTRLEVIAQNPPPAPLPAVPPPQPAVPALQPEPEQAPAALVSAAVPQSVLAFRTPDAPPAPAEHPSTEYRLRRHSPSGYSPPSAGTAHPAGAAPQLGQLLRRSGFSDTLVGRLLSAPEAANTGERPLHQCLLEVADRIRVLAQPVHPIPLPRRTAFVGLPGAGATTALCKWLSAEVFSRRRKGSVASIEFDKPKGAEDLAVFAELLGLDFSRQIPSTAVHSDDRFCYADTPALSLTRSDENRRLRAFLDENHLPGRVLVLSALHDSCILRQACAAGQQLGCTHVVFTQLDELPQWGKLWDFLIEPPMSPLMLALGPSLTGEYETDVVGTVLRRTFPWS